MQFKKINISLIILFIILFQTPFFNLWGENIYRRLLHHLQNGRHTFNKKPWIHFFDDHLSSSDISNLQQIANTNQKTECLNNYSKTLSNIFGGNYSRRCSLYYNDFTDTEKQTLDNLGNRLKVHYEQILGKTLYLSNTNFRACILQYEGADSKFTFHYDTEAHNCFRSLYLFNGEGEVSPFMYLDENGNLIKKKLQEGCGLFFRGTTTWHGVGESKDPNMKRYMVGFQYSLDNSVENKNLCSEFRSQKPSRVIVRIIPYLLVMSLCIYAWNKIRFLRINIRSLYIILFTILTYIINISLAHKTPCNIGTNLRTPPLKLVLFLIFCVLSSIFSPMNGLVLFCYILWTEMLLPSSIVMKQLYNVGHTQVCK